MWSGRCEATPQAAQRCSSAANAGSIILKKVLPKPPWRISSSLVTKSVDWITRGTADNLATLTISERHRFSQTSEFVILLLNPNTSILLVLDSSAPNASIEAVSIASVNQLIAAATLVAAPAFVAHSPNRTTHLSNITATYSSASAAPHDFDATAADFSTTSLGQIIAATGRTQLIVCGHWLEADVTLAVLRALAIGYDTFFPVDAAPTYDLQHISIAHMRLVHAGAAPTTTAQILREWSALTRPSATSNALLALLD
jgi:hypothetical protein